MKRGRSSMMFWSGFKMGRGLPARTGLQISSKSLLNTISEVRSQETGSDR